jgi:hypothetical protein
MTLVIPSEPKASRGIAIPPGEAPLYQSARSGRSNSTETQNARRSARSASPWFLCVPTERSFNRTGRDSSTAPLMRLRSE